MSDNLPGAPQRLVGRRLGQYEVRSVLGVGGMGEVYLARDTRLDRDVALKVLPEIFAADPGRLARFDREARVLASLNHPHIGAIYGIEECDGGRALVLEFVAGQTLGERIAQGAIVVDEALQIARQIAKALAAAHAHAIIHRDLKPANIKLRSDGTVKVLDFGLARTLQPEASDPSASHEQSATTTALTGIGRVLGTAGYMSPEQAKGRPVDRRSDNWAFGCVLFEMLTARRAFAADDPAEVLAAVLTREPDWQALPPSTPSSVRRLLRRCLEKDRTRRLADIDDALLELDEPMPDAAATVPVQTASGAPRPRSSLPWLLAAAVIGAALTSAVFMFLGRRTVEAPVYRTSILLPGQLGTAFRGPFDQRGPSLALSPSGRRLAFVATETSGRTQLWLRALDSPVAQPLAGTDGAAGPFWSPDGRHLAFVADGALRRIDIASGAVATVCAGAWASGAWSKDDVLLFTESTNHALARVPAAGGLPSAVTTIDAKAREMGHLFPSFLPDGRHFVYAAIAGPGLTLGVYTASFDSTTRTSLPLDAPFAQYAGGFLWFGRGGALMAQRFDPEERALSGEAVPIADQLPASRPGSYFSVSPSGALVFQPDPSPGNELTWFDRAGHATGTLGDRDDYADLSLSPDDQRALVSVGEPGTSNRDLWIFDVARGLRTRFTSDPAPETHSTWSPDGTRVVFDRRMPGQFGLYVKPSDGVGEATTLLADGFDDNPTSWSPDGRFLLYIKRDVGAYNLWVLPLAERSATPFPFTRTQFNVPGEFSPDGRWVVYASTDSGRMEVYVLPFPGPGPRFLVSTAGGWDPRWRGDGKEILYLDISNRRLMSAPVTVLSDRVDVGSAKRLFDLTKVSPRSSYDVSRDGQRILALTRKDDARSTPLTLILNWPALMTGGRETAATLGVGSAVVQAVPPR